MESKLCAETHTLSDMIQLAVKKSEPERGSVGSAQSKQPTGFLGPDATAFRF